jgi:catechol 2,3-dioxygenase-like lactoylglutathione lyase family enzyme
MTEATPARFDHIVVAVKDLNKAIATYRNGLGFTVVPGGDHPTGTHNALVHFGLSYVELLAVRDPANPQAKWLKEWIATAGEHPPTFAVAVPDIDAAVARLDEGEIPHGEIEQGQRTTPEGKTLRWRSVVVAPESTPKTQSPAVIAAGVDAKDAIAGGDCSLGPATAPAASRPAGAEAGAAADAVPHRVGGRRPGTAEGNRGYRRARTAPCRMAGIAQRFGARGGP